MPIISKEKKEKISEQILHYLFSVNPESKFTAQISKEIARDEEFTKVLLQDLKTKGILVEIKKNKNGLSYIQRQRWRLSNTAYQAYLKHQTSLNSFNNTIQQTLDKDSSNI